MFVSRKKYREIEWRYLSERDHARAGWNRAFSNWFKYLEAQAELDALRRKSLDT